MSLTTPIPKDRLPPAGRFPCAGFGDTAASVVGRLCGRHAICRGSRKTVEGTLGGLAATLLAWWLAGALAPGLGAARALPWPALLAATALSSLLEAATTQLDNLFVPLHYFALLCCGAALSGGQT